MVNPTQPVFTYAFIGRGKERRKGDIEKEAIWCYSRGSSSKRDDHTNCKRSTGTS